MNKTLIITLSTLGLLALIALVPQPATATKAIAQQENLACTSCHDKPGSKLLTDKGKYYETMGSLEGFDQVQSQFEKCTTCHVKKPGSQKLTETGKKYQWVAEDMDGLRIWLMEQHPTPAEMMQEQEQEEN
jgi:cytochrome c553